TLPRMQSVEPALSDVEIAAENGALANKKVLVVDDNRDAADSLTKLLNVLGSDAHATYSGREALSKINDLEPDIMLLDISMPYMDGYELLQTIRRNGFADTPIVALSGYGMKEDHQKMKAAGFDAILTK